MSKQAPIDKIPFDRLENLINLKNPSDLKTFLRAFGWDYHAYFEAVVSHDAEFLDRNFSQYFGD